MKIKFISTIIIIMLMSISVKAQTTQAYNEMETKWKTAINLYEKGLYVPAQKLFSEILLHQGQEYAAYKDDAAFYFAISSMNLFNNDAEFQITNFIEDHPESRNNNNASFQMANFKFRNKDYKNSIQWYEKTDRLLLSSDEQSEYFFKLGFSHFARKDFDRAAKAFYESKDANNIYGPMSLYFYSHLKYINEQYQTALLGFLELENSPSFASITPFYIIHIYFLQEKYDELIEYAPKILEKESGNRAAEINKLLGSAYYRKAKYSDAIPYLNNYVKSTNSANDYDYYELGFAYYNNRQYDKAANSFSKIANMKDTLSQNAAYHMADCYLNLNKKVDALRSFEVASKYNFNQQIKEDALFNFAQLSFELSLSPFNEAINAFTLYIKEYPNSPRTDLAYDYLIDAFLSTKNYQASISTIEKMQNRNTKIDAAYQRLTYYRGLEYFTQLKYNEAINMFDKSLDYKIYDKTINSLTHYWKAEANYRLGNIDQAIEMFKEFVNSTGSVSLDEYSKAHYNLGYAYFNKKEYTTANSWFRKFELQPGYANSEILNDVLNRIGDCYYIEREFIPAAEYYKKAIDIGKVSPDYTLYQMALSYGGLKKSNEKVWSLRKLILEHPESEYLGNANFEIGRTYHTTINNPDSAKFYYIRHINNFPNSSMRKASLSSLGAIYFNERDYQKALDNYKQVIAEYPNTEEAKSAAEMIKAIYIEQDNPDGFVDWANTSGTSISEDEQDEIMWQIAKKNYVDKKYNEALNSLTNYLKSFPKGQFYIEANYYKAELHFYFEEKNQALENYKIVANAPIGSFTEESTIKASSILFDQKEWLEAYNLYEKLFSLAENKSTKLLASIGKLRCAYNLNNWDNTIAAAVKIIDDDRSNEEQKREAHFKMAKAYYNKENLIRALNLFENLAKETKSSEGAEAMYRVIKINYKMQKDSIAEDLAYEFAQSNSPHAYWVAKSLICLAEIYYDRDDFFSAKHTLQSILNNYPIETDGIKDETSEKLTNIIDEEQGRRSSEDLLNLKINLLDDEENDKIQKLYNEDNKIELPEPAEIK
ncbi:MAG: tetratricopeptide repeat protein [Bacteroidales bacterium]|nr:tetratricopeptide repeat protein [Bacteroidales bacterium]